ncbi:MAG: ABC transporter permease [Verrucomicrobia bacterium]|nr:ABC transporter permease [Verrucomicrobiota bacterium]MBS0636875.1 ABC transporter permease [Verrucomicrobiota bacterium]
MIPLTQDDRAAILALHEPKYHKPRSLFSVIRSHKSILIGSSILCVLILLAIFGPLLSPYTFEETNLPSKNMAPSFEHIFGTDELGRDMWTRVCVGLRISLEIGLAAACIDILLGVTWGMIAALAGGTTDHVMMRIAEMIFCLPYLLFAILITVIIGPGFAPILAAMVIIGWIQMARITRSLVLGIKETEYFRAARSLGVGTGGLIMRHILPNISGPVTCIVMLSIPQAIFAEAFLSFLGIGMQPPLASLGSLVSDALGSMRFYPWRLFIPSVTITLTIFSFNLLGDGLRDMLDPQSRRSLGS